MVTISTQKKYLICHKNQRDPTPELCPRYVNEPPSSLHVLSRNDCKPASESDTWQKTKGNTPVPSPARVFKGNSLPEASDQVLVTNGPKIYRPEIGHVSLTTTWASYVAHPITLKMIRPFFLTDKAKFHFSFTIDETSPTHFENDQNSHKHW